MIILVHRYSTITCAHIIYAQILSKNSSSTPFLPSYNLVTIQYLSKITQPGTKKDQSQAYVGREVVHSLHLLPCLNGVTCSLALCHRRTAVVAATEVTVAMALMIGHCWTWEDTKRILLTVTCTMRSSPGTMVCTKERGPKKLGSDLLSILRLGARTWSKMSTIALWTWSLSNSLCYSVKISLRDQLFLSAVFFSPKVWLSYITWGFLSNRKIN